MSGREELIEEIRVKCDRLNELTAVRRKHDEENDYATKIGDLQEQIKNILWGFEAEAGLEVDDDNKKIYTNEKLRQGRAKELAAESAEYVEANKELAKTIEAKTKHDLLSNDLRREARYLVTTIPALVAILQSGDQVALMSNTVKAMENRLKDKLQEVLNAI